MLSSLMLGFGLLALAGTQDTEARGVVDTGRKPVTARKHGRTLNLIPSFASRIDEQARRLASPIGAGAPASHLLQNTMMVLRSMASPAGGTTTGPSVGSGCDTGVASAAVGANVPSTYFGVPSPGSNPSFPGAVQLLTSGVLDLDELTITLPLYEGVYAPTGESVWYVSTDTDDAANAQALGLNLSSKLTFGDVGNGSRTGRLSFGGRLVFDQGAVDFTPERILMPGAEPMPFPPAVAQPGSVGDRRYSPLIKIQNTGGHIFNMPAVGWGPADDLLQPNGRPDYAHVHDKVRSIDFDDQTVTLALTAGFSFGRAVLYLSLDANVDVAAALEAATLAPGLNDIEVGSDDSLFSAVERIFIGLNGARGCENPQRQGLFAAITDGAEPFNVLGGIPTIAPDYSPLWDANIFEWTQDAINRGYRSRLIDEFQILSFVENGFLTGPGGMPFGSTGVIINCPIVHRFL